MEYIGMIIGLFIISLGSFFQRKPSEYGTNVGINMKRARKNKENWNFTQKACPKLVIGYGVVITLLNGILLVILMNQNVTELFIEGISIVTSVIFIIVLFVHIELRIIKFEQKNNRSN